VKFVEFVAADFARDRDADFKLYQIQIQRKVRNEKHVRSADSTKSLHRYNSLNTLTLQKRQVRPKNKSW